MAMKAPMFEQTEAFEKRARRARETYWMMAVTGPNQFAIRGRDSDAHLIETSGMEAIRCSCPDYEHNVGPDGMCKHMIAYEEWEIDEVMG